MEYFKTGKSDRVGRPCTTSTDKACGSSTKLQVFSNFKMHKITGILKLLKCYLPHIHFCRSEDEDCEDMKSDHDSPDEDEDTALSQYEMRRKKRIAENRRNFEEHFKQVQKKETPTVHILRLCT